MQDIAKIKWLYIARLFSLCGGQIMFFVVPLLIFKLTHSAVYTGCAFSLEWIARIISFPLSGFFADRFGAKRIYIASDLMIAVLSLLSIILMILFKDLMIILLVLLSVFAGFLSEQGYVSAESLAPKLIESSYYAKNQSILELLEQFALLFGPTVAGIFILYFDAESLIKVSLILYTLSAAAMCGVDVKADSASVKKRFINQDLFEGFVTILKSEYLTNIILLSVMMNFTFGLMTGAAPIMVLGQYSMSDKYYALLNLSAGIAGFFAIYVFNLLIKKHSIVSVGMGAYILTCLLCMSISLANKYTYYLIIYAFFYGTSGAFSVFFRSERARIIPHSVLGRTIGAIIFVTFLFFPLAGVLISASQHFISLASLVSFSGILFLIMGTILFSKMIKVSNIACIDES